METSAPAADIGYAIVEVMGHSVFAGYVSERAIGGGSFLQVDVPATADHPAFSKLLGHGSIFGITPTDEETCRRYASSIGARPLTIYLPPPERPRPQALPYGMPDDDAPDDDMLL